MRARGWRGWASPLLAVALVAALAGCAGLGGGSTSEPVLPCNGRVISDGVTPILTLRNADADHEVSAPVGSVVEIRMDGQHAWNLGTVTPAGALTLIGAQGVLEKGECVWDFRVAQTGVATVQMVGGAHCQPNHPCPAYAILAKFIIRGV